MAEFCYPRYHDHHLMLTLLQGWYQKPGEVVHAHYRQFHHELCLPGHSEFHLPEGHAEYALPLRLGHLS